MGGFPLARGRSDEGWFGKWLLRGYGGRIKAGKIGEISEKLGDHNMMPIDVVDVEQCMLEIYKKSSVKDDKDL